MGEVQRRGADLMMILGRCWDERGHLGLSKPCCAGGAGQGWSRVPEGASTCGAVFYLSACPGCRDPAAGVGSAWGLAMLWGHFGLFPRRWGHLRRGQSGSGEGRVRVSALPPAVCLPLLAHCDRDKLRHRF